jgi:FG-GAP repeat
LAHPSDGPEVTLRYDAAACESGGPNQLFIDLIADGKSSGSFSVSAEGAPAACDRLGRSVQSGDFNFDGRDDLAVAVDNTGPYGGPTYEVLLFRPETGGYEPAPALSALTREYLGMFAVDSQSQRLIASSKSGCCEHSTIELRLSSAGEPVVTNRKTIKYEAERCRVTTERTLATGGTETKTHPCTKVQR